MADLMGCEMKIKAQNILLQLTSRYPDLKSEEKVLFSALQLLIQCFKNQGKLLVCGNGGSCADSAHITGELVKSFCLPRALCPLEKRLFENDADSTTLAEKLQYGLPCIDLTSNSALITAISNDTGAEFIFAQQVFTYGREGDVFLGISTSGNSKNVYLAAKVAKIKGLKVLALQGANRSSKLAQLADVLIAVPETETHQIQELHLPIYHALCLALEEQFFGD